MKRCYVMVILLIVVFALCSSVQARSSPTSDPKEGDTRVRSLRVVVLSTMLVDWIGKSGNGIGEWGFAAIVEADGHRLLFDTGARPTTVLENARELGIDLSTVTEVFLSHHHFDHTGGLLTLRRELSKENPGALKRAHVAKGMFYERLPPAFTTKGLKTDYEATGGVFIVHDKPYEIFPGVWITGPVPRIHPERNWSGKGRIKTPDGIKEDTIPEDQSLVIDTEQGLVLISGCGHSGVINTMEFVQDKIRPAPVYAAVGGFHLMEADDAHLAWTAEKMHTLGITQLLGAHCTGINAVFTLRELLNLDRRTGVVGAVGAAFELEKGIIPGLIAH